MKTLTALAVAAGLLAAPAMAQEAAQPAQTGQAASAVAVNKLLPPNRTELSKPWKTGERMPSAFARSSRYEVDFSEYGLIRPARNYKWVLVGDNAYLVNEDTYVIRQIAGVTPKS